MHHKESTDNRDIINKITPFLSLISLALIATTATQRDSINMWLKDRREKYDGVKADQNYCCGGCGQQLSNDLLEVHHLLPKSRGGTNHPSNLIALGTSIKNGGCGCHDKWDEEALS